MKPKSFAALLLLFAAGLAGAAERTREQTFTYSLLTDDAPTFVIMGAKAVSRAPRLAPDVLDVVAARLVERAATPNASRQEIDASAWLIRALGAGRQARHRAAIEQAMAGYQNDKIGKYAEAALAVMTEGDATPAPAIDLAGLRTQLQTERGAMRGGERKAPADVAFGTPLETVLAELGYPDRIGETSRTDGAMMVKITQPIRSFTASADMVRKPRSVFSSFRSCRTRAATGIALIVMTAAMNEAKRIRRWASTRK